MYSLELFQESCKTFNILLRRKIDCSGNDGFYLEYLVFVFEPDLQFLEFDNYHRGRDWKYGLAKVEENKLEKDTRKEIDSLTDSMSDIIETIEEGGLDEFFSSYDDALETDYPENFFYSQSGPEESKVWKEAKAKLYPYFLFDELPRLTLKYGEYKRGQRKILEEARHEVQIILQSLSNPVLHATFTGFLLDIREVSHNSFTKVSKGDGYSDPLFTGEFTDTRKHADPKLINYGYILSVIVHLGEGRAQGQAHAICVARQYPFATFGDQSLVVLDSGVKTALVFPNYIEMTQYLRANYPVGLHSFISVYGYSQKRYEPIARRETIRSKYEENLSTLTAMIARYAPSPALPPSVSVANASASAGGGAGSTGLGGGKTFFSFFSF